MNTELKKGDTVVTPNGNGIIQYVEYHKNPNKLNNRVCVNLDNNPFGFPIVCYWVTELK